MEQVCEDKIILSEGGEVPEQRSCGCTIPGNVKGQVGGGLSNLV